MNLANFHRSMFESLEIGTLMGSFYPKYKMYELKTYRGVLCHGNEEWFKIWRGIDLTIQHWQEEIDKFWPRWAIKNLKNLHFNGLLLNKIYNFWTKKRTEELYLMALKIDAKFKRKMISYKLKNSGFILESKMTEVNWKQNLLIYFENLQDVPYSQ